ncbi:hypothetical protein [Corallibacter sp.]|uniref:hypothetical protein n=1 Tax=Corallibacter sp. TaxID=2038084 RepID=UPI003AB453A2
MKFYHFTRKDAVKGILESGIQRGIVPFEIPNTFVSLTSELRPDDNGLISGQKLLERKDREFDFLSKQFPMLISGLSPNRTLQLFDQTEAVVEVAIDELDNRLFNYDRFIDFMLQHHKIPGSERMRYKAAGLASARFPLGAPIEEQTREAEKILVSGQEMAPHWFFYKGVVTPEMISRVMYRQGIGEYS